MVQVIRGGPSRSQMLSDLLGPALGGGLANFTGNYLANKSLDKVLNDASYKDKPLSEKWNALERAMSTHGERGQNILQRRMGIEQQAFQENQQKQLQKGTKELWNQFNPGQPMPEGITIKDILNSENIKSKERIAQNRSQRPVGGLSGQPVPPEIAQAIPQIIDSNKNASPDELASAFDKAGIPRAYSNSFVESRRQSSKPIFEPEAEKLEAKRVSELASQIEKDYLSAKNEDLRLERMEKLSDSGNLSTPAMAKVMDFIGLPIGILQNLDSEEFRKLETDFIRDARDVFPGGRITNYEIQSYLRTVPTLLNSKEGREAIIRNRKLFNEAKRMKYDEYKNILKENNGRKPPNLGILLEERVSDKMLNLEERFKEGIEKEIEKHQSPLRMSDESGNVYDIPPGKIEMALKKGLKFR